MTTEKRKLYSKQYYATNKARINRRSKEYYLLHSDEIKERSLAQQTERRAARRRWLSEYKERHPCEDCKLYEIS